MHLVGTNGHSTFDHALELDLASVGWAHEVPLATISSDALLNASSL